MVKIEEETFVLPQKWVCKETNKIGPHLCAYQDYSNFSSGPREENEDGLLGNEEQSYIGQEQEIVRSHSRPEPIQAEKGPGRNESHPKYFNDFIVKLPLSIDNKKPAPD
ncbi:hypothetical protein E3N88_14106 [Mikania micrantha]|uniref:Uncharacterized protein n=1 Tax=Mikania micrantha TaxID=192012 RepID=A0A5N6P357_9ASTR|nr:hypothetical protein E3N88_14106 [Mikania micrantha]